MSLKLELPPMTRKRWGMLLLAAALATFLRIMLQGLIPAGTSSGVGESIVVKAGLLIPAFTIYAFIAFLAFGYTFLLIERSLPARSGLGRGLLYGGAMALVWIAYLFEPVPLGANTPFPDILAYPIADGVSMVVFGLLLGRLVAIREPSDSVIALRPLAPLVGIFAAFLLIRLFEYNVLHIYSVYASRPVDTMLWVVVTALVICLVYVLLRAGIPAHTPKGKGLVFGVVVFGVLLTLINFFVPLALDVNVADLAFRTAMDIVAVTIGAWIGELLGSKGRS